MKRSTAFLLSFLLLFFSITPNIVFAETSIAAESPYLDVGLGFTVDVNELYKQMWGDFTYKDAWEAGWNLGTAPLQWAKEQLSNFMDDSGKVDTSNPDSPIQSDGTYIYINQNFVNGMNQQVQDSVHALDGYYLLEPTADIDEYFYQQYNTLSNYGIAYTNFSNVKDKTLIAQGNIFYSAGTVSRDYSGTLALYCNSSLSSVKACYIQDDLSHTNVNFYGYTFPDGTLYHSAYNNHNLSYVDFASTNFKIFRPTKVFYSITDAKNYVRRNGRQYYAPNINTGGSGLKIPVQAIANNTINNINQNTNITYEGKTEAEIQAQIDATINQRLQELLDNMATPTPTPNPDTTDIPIITPTPDAGGGSGNTGNTGDTTNPFIEKIYNWLTSFGEKHDTFEKKLSTYLEENNTKLDTIITALDKIGTGQTTGEENGCKYDYTALSEFLTNLWNESDKKFDTMVELLEKNNDYQKEILKSLDEIKALLIADTVLDFFQNRSQETANKAKDKFPTSLPWDVAMVVNTMCAEPVTPVIHCPIVIESLGIKEEIIIDLTGEEWTKLAKTTRSLLSILFVLFLVHLSKDMFYKGGDSV